MLWKELKLAKGNPIFQPNGNRSSLDFRDNLIKICQPSPGHQTWPNPSRLQSGNHQHPPSMTWRIGGSLIHFCIIMLESCNLASKYIIPCHDDPWCQMWFYSPWLQSGILQVWLQDGIALYNSYNARELQFKTSQENSWNINQSSATFAEPKNMTKIRVFQETRLSMGKE